jgi:hypothetical protein
MSDFPKRITHWTSVDRRRLMSVYKYAHLFTDTLSYVPGHRPKFPKGALCCKCGTQRIRLELINFQARSSCYSSRMMLTFLIR